MIFPAVLVIVESIIRHVILFAFSHEFDVYTLNVDKTEKKKYLPTWQTSVVGLLRLTVYRNTRSLGENRKWHILANNAMRNILVHEIPFL